MKCDECKGRGHFLMPMSTPSCAVCKGTGQIEQEILEQAMDELRSYVFDRWGKPGSEIRRDSYRTRSKTIDFSLKLGEEVKRDNVED